MEKLVVANWKANLTLSKAEKWLATLTRNYSPVTGLHVILAVPVPFLSDLHSRFKVPPGISWAAQDVSPFPLGSYTGSVPAALLGGLVDHVIVGHRERRKYFHETIQDVANKVSEALEEDIRPILCVDEVIARQQAASLDFKDIERLVVAYTPDDSEQLEIARGSKTLAEQIPRISSLFPGAKVMYGGGVTAANVAELFQLPGLSGVMVAGGCLDPEAFVGLLGNAGEVIAGNAQ